MGMFLKFKRHFHGQSYFSVIAIHVHTDIATNFFGRWLKIFKNVGHRGWPTKKILGSGATKTVNFGWFPI